MSAAATAPHTAPLTASDRSPATPVSRHRTSTIHAVAIAAGKTMSGWVNKPSAVTTANSPQRTGSSGRRTSPCPHSSKAMNARPVSV